MPTALTVSNIPSLQLLSRGKVRDLYAVDEQRLLMVATDRLSAFDVILPTPIPGKGQVLTRISQFWFDHLAHILPNHLTGDVPESVVLPNEYDQVAGRAMVVKRLSPLPIEAVVRGYLVGSGWKEYQAQGSVCGLMLPEGLRLAEKLPQVLFTPSTKAVVGDHDENIDYTQVETLLGVQRAAQVRDLSIALYTEASKWALSRGIIIADTKFEFGVDRLGVLHVIDEVLTPDSSRFWPAEGYQTGSNPASFDKQFVRDWLEKSGWNKIAPAPELPPDIALKTAEKYQEAATRLVAA